MSNQLKAIFPPKEVQPADMKSLCVSAAKQKQNKKHLFLRGYALKPDGRAEILQALKDNNYVPGSNTDWPIKLEWRI